MAMTTTSQVPNNVDAFYSRVLLEEAFPLMIHDRFAQVKNIPAGAGTKTIRFRRYTNLLPKSSTLTEGTTPTSDQLAITNIESTPGQYGAFVQITDEVDLIQIDPVFTEASRLQGQQAGQTWDNITRDIVNAGTSVSYGGTATSRVTVAAGDVLTAAMIKASVLSLKLNNAKKITRMVTATDGVSTTPIDRAYVGMIHPTITATLKGLTGFVPVEKYSSQMTVMAGEIGKLDEMRFIESTDAKIFTGLGAAGIDVYSIVVFAQDAYATTAITGAALQSIRKPYGAGDDPLNQRATIGWKGWHTAEILNQDFLTRIEVAAV